MDQYLELDAVSARAERVLTSPAVEGLLDPGDNHAARLSAGAPAPAVEDVFCSRLRNDSIVARLSAQVPTDPPIRASRLHVAPACRRAIEIDEVHQWMPTPGRARKGPGTPATNGRLSGFMPSPEIATG